jgi:hypothetical protein
MSKSRVIAAESLRDVLELARLRRQSGLLSIEHDQEGRVEEGEIYFQDGQLVSARIGQMSGQEALAQLLGWRHIHFAFLSHVYHPPTNIPVQFARVIESSPSIPLATVPPSPTSSPQFVDTNISTRAMTEPDHNYPTISSLLDLHPSLTESLIPQKLEEERDVLSLPLTRPQRCIYLLVNGRRTISDLARTTGKDVQDVKRILSELQEQGFISV